MGTKRERRVDSPVNALDILERRVFPKDIVRVSTNYLESAGFQFGPVVDENFQEVTYPNGWRVSQTHVPSMFHMTDHLGRQRGGIIFESDPYMASAHFAARFSVETEGADGTTEVGGNKLRYVILDGYQVHARGPLEEKKEDETLIQLWSRCMAAGAAWLQERYPNYQNAELYWDEEEE